MTRQLEQPPALDQAPSPAVRGSLDPRPTLGLVRRNRDFGRLYTANLISYLGDWFATVALLGLALQVTGSRTREVAGILRRHLATYAGAEDLISVGAYARGSNPEIDAAIERRPDIEGFLVQAIGERAAMADTLRRAGSIAGVEVPEEELSDAAVPVQA